jgi:5-methylcytosine-specific restriction endonuclease McrA
MGILSLLFRSIFGRGFNPIVHEIERQNRRDYYRNDYLKSEAWQRKRYLVMKRDNGKCVYCGECATQVHHKRYARNIGKEPIDWLVAICTNCHEAKH